MRLKFICLVVLSSFFADVTLAQTWSALNGPPGANVNDLERTSVAIGSLPSGTLLMVANQTLYQSTNGVNWTKTVITTPVNNFYLDDIMVAGNKLYALNYSVVYISTDGTNWTKQSTDGQFYGMYHIMKFGPDNFLAAWGWNGVFVSKDDGVNWAQISTDNLNDYGDLAANAAGDLFEATDAGIIKRYLYPGVAGSYNLANWTNVYTNPAAGSTYTLNLGVDGSNNIYAQTYYYDGVSAYPYDILRSSAASNGAAWVSVKNGITDTYSYNSQGRWKFVGNAVYLFDSYLNKISYNANPNPFTITGTTTNGNTSVNVSSITGLKIGDLVSGTNIPASATITAFGASSITISSAATGNGSGLTLTIKPSWTTITSPTANSGTQMTAVAFNTATNYFIGSSGDGVYATTTGNTASATFTLSNQGLNAANGTEVEVANTTGTILYITNGNSKSYYKSTDNGTTWSSSTPFADYVRKILKLGDGTLLLYGDKVYKSTDNAASFAATDNIYHGFNDIDPDPTDGTFSKLYAINYNTLYRSSDKGSTWTTSSTITGLPSSYSLYYLAVDASGNPYTILYNSDNSKYELYKITGITGTTTLTATATLVPNAPWLANSYFYPNNLFVTGGKVYASEYNGFYSTGNDGVAWSTNTFSGSYVFPITGTGAQSGVGGLCVSRNGTFYVSQDGGQSWNSTTLPSSNSYITDVAKDNSGNYIAAAQSSPALKFTGSLIVDPATLPPYINFGWQPTNGPWGGNISKIFVDNSNKSYAWGNNNLYSTTNFSSWTNVAQGNYFYDVDFDKTNNVLYGAYYNSLSKSTDGGTTWTQVVYENFGSAQYIKRCSNGDIVISDGQKVYVSTNGGTSFGASKYTLPSSSYLIRIYTTSTLPKPGIFVWYSDATNNYASTIAKSVDQGATWTTLAGPPVAGAVPDVPSTSGNTLYWTTYNNNTGNNDIFKSTDNGTTWSSIKGDMPNASYRDLYVSPTNDLYLASTYNGSDGFYKSVNGGINWIWLPFPAGVNFNFSAVNWVGTRMEIGTANEGVYTSDDGGLTYTQRSTGIPKYISDIELMSPKKMMALGNGNYISTDFQNWSTSIDYSFRGFLRKPDGTLLAYDYNKLYQTPDGGTTWNVISNNLPSNLNSIATADGINYYVGTYDNKIYFSNNLSTWSLLNASGLPSTYNVYDIAIDQNGIIYVVLYNYSSNQQEAYEILFGSGIKISQPVSPSNVEFSQNQIFIYDYNGAVFATTDGSTWTKKSTPSGDKLIIASQNYYFIPSYGGNLWLSRDQGQTWQNVGLGLTNSNLNFNDIIVNEYNGYAYGAVSNSPVLKSANIVIPADVVAPVVSALSPVNNSTGASVKPPLSITFDQAALAVATKTIKIHATLDPNNTIESFDAAVGVQNGKTFTFTPTNPLSFNTSYFITTDFAANTPFTDIFGNKWAGISNTTTWKFTTRAQPTIASTLPVNNATSIVPNTTLAITFGEPMTGTSGKKINIYKVSAPSSPVLQLDAATGVASGNTITYTLTSPLEFQTQYFVTSDPNGFTTAEGATISVIQSNTDWVFTTKSAPTVVSTTPASGASSVNLSPSLVITFSEAVTFGAGKKLNITKIGQVNPVASVDLTSGAVSGAQVTFGLSSPLEYSTGYFASLDANAIVSSGVTMSLLTSNSAWTFTTIDPPTISSTIPAGAATGVAINTGLSVTFNGPVQFVAGKKLYVTEAGKSTPVATLDLSAGTVSGNTVTFVLSTPLAYSTSYFIMADPSAFNTTLGVAFSLLTSNTSWTFTTAAPPDTAPPVIAFTAPTITKGTANKFQVTITDDTGVTSAQMFYRAMTSTGTFTKKDLTFNTSTSKWEVDIDDSWLDAMGLEYYLTALDASSNQGRLPAAGAMYSNLKLSASPALTGIGAGGTEQDYKIISIPYILTDNKVSTVFNEIANGTVDKTQWRLITYGGNEKWLEYGDGFSTIARGKGYWINVRTSTSVQIEGASTPTDNRSSLFPLNLVPGWNQIGNPYTVDILWSDIKAQNSNIGNLKMYNRGWSNGSTLKPFEGGFVFVSGSSPVAAKVLFTGIPIGGRTFAVEELVGTDLSQNDWVIPITIQQGGMTNSIGGVGMHRDASLSYDQFDDFSPPHFLNYAEMIFDHPEHAIKHFTRDVVPTQGEFVWEYNLDTNSEEPGELTWDQNSFGNNDKDLFLLDEQTQTVVNMREVGHFSFNPKESRAFKIFFGTNLKTKVKPNRVFLGKAFPNPTTGLTTIPFSLPDGGSGYQVSLDVYDVMGKKISTIISGIFNAGFYNSEWDVSLKGLSGGIYTYRLAVTSSNGTDVQSGKVIIEK